jgi:hypothetical protein
MADATPDFSKQQLEFEKLDFEVKELRQKLKYNTITLVLGLATIIVSVTAYFIDQYKIREQRTWETFNEMKSARIKRMTEIASEFDQMLGTTIHTLNTNIAETVIFASSVETLEKQLQFVNTRNSRDAIAAIKKFRARLVDEPTSFESYSNAMALQEDWNVKKTALSPDFEILFGTALNSEWKEISELGWTAINSKYNPMSSDIITETQKKVKQLEEVGSKYQLKLHQAISKERTIDVEDFY